MSRRWNWLWMAAVAVLLGWTVWSVLGAQSPAELALALTSADWRYLTLGLLLMAAFICCEGRASHLILRALGSPQPYRRCCFYSCSGFFFSNITPSATGGQPMQVYYMKRDGVPVVHGAMDMLLVTIGYHTAVVIFGAAALLFRGELLAVLGGGVGFLLGLGFAIFLVLDGAMLLLLFLPGPMERLGRFGIRLAFRLRPALDRERLEKRLAEELERYGQGARVLRSSPALLPQVILLSMGQLACSYAVPCLVCLAFGVEGVPFWTVFCLQVLCTIAVGYLPLPGSAGAAEGVFLQVFTYVFGPGLVAPAMILTRTVSCYAVLLATGGITAVGHLRGKRQHEACPEPVPAKERAAKMPAHLNKGNPLT